MSSTYGKNVIVSVFGQSHSPAVGVTVDGLPAGFKIDMEKLRCFLARRAPGQNAYSTQRKEADMPEFISGLCDNVTCGAPLTAIIRNTDVRSQDYAKLKDCPRPGHADYTAAVKYGGYQDADGGGHFSGRLTAPLCVAGGICLQMLEREGIAVFARIAEIGGISDDGKLTAEILKKPFAVNNDKKGKEMLDCIENARTSLDSVGGIIECCVTGLSAGLGDPMFDGMENRIAQIIFGIPAVKGLEFGAGFAAARMRGSENNDEFTVTDGRIITETNNCGGILGGITDGMPIQMRVAIKPTPSIGKKQNSVSLSDAESTEIEIKGRHDPCIVPRAVPVVEAASAIAVFDALLEYKKYRR